MRRLRAYINLRRFHSRTKLTRAANKVCVNMRSKICVIANASVARHFDVNIDIRRGSNTGGRFPRHHRPRRKKVSAIPSVWTVLKTSDIEKT